MLKMAKRVAAKFQIEAMANLRPSTTGVEDAVIWVSAGEFSGKELQHGPRIKVVLGDKITTDGLANAVSVKLTNPPKILGKLPSKISRQVVKFVNLNREVLLRHWNGELDSKEMLELLKRVA
jgi:hypothetical protein